MRVFYRFLLRFYPKTYREEYGKELCTVFGLSIEEATKVGKSEVVRVFFRELLGLAGAILLEHVRERRNINSRRLAPGLKVLPDSPAERLAVFAPFIITFGLLYFSGFVADQFLWVGSMLRLSLLGFILILLVLGFSKGFPRWFLPYLGFIFSIVNIFAFNAILDPKWRGFSFLSHAPQFIQNFIMQGLLLMGIIILTFLLILFALLIPKFRPFYRRVRNDWTLLSFIIYGTAPFAILLTFDDYEKHGDRYLVGSLLILAIGGLFYLRSKGSWKKFLFLYIGVALSLAVAAVGRAILCKNGLFDEYLLSCTWQDEMMDTMTMWLWLAIFMLLSSASNLLPRVENQVAAA
jgi:hypothetical protein